MSKFLDINGVETLWNEIKKLIKSKIDGNVGLPNGTASLDENGKLKENQLPDLKTINNESIIGKGNITINLNIYKIVEALPEQDIDESKIYLVLSDNSGEQNIYTEFVYINNGWEKLGEYKATIDVDTLVTQEEFKEYKNNTFPKDGEVGQVLTKTETGVEWKDTNLKWRTLE